MNGMLYLIGTPIGNREDITLRAIKTLFGVDVLLCEDTRQSAKLLDMVSRESFIVNSKDSSLFTEHKPQLIRFDMNVERMMTRKVLMWLKEGKTIGLVTDAGMPGVSDPGAYLVNQCYAEGIDVEVIPGPSALTSAMSLAGMKPGKVLFTGFLPETIGKRLRIYEQIRLSDGLVGQVILYESPHRLTQTLTEIKDYLHDPLVAAMGELTKMHEKVIRGTASEVLDKVGDGEEVKGEWVIVISLTG